MKNHKHGDWHNLPHPTKTCRMKSNINNINNNGRANKNKNDKAHNMWGCKDKDRAIARSSYVLIRVNI